MAGSVRVGVPKESASGERRVAATPESVKKLIAAGFAVTVERGAGVASGIEDAAFVDAGAAVGDGAEVWGGSDVVAKVRPPSHAEVDKLREGAVLVSLLQPERDEKLPELIAARKASAIALERIPRITRAQKMDVLSSMANLAGYRAVVEAAQVFQRTFGPQVTAAGTIPPARVLVIGAGVAGLAAVAAARALGAEVRAFDTRAATKEQIESLGAKYLTVEIEEDAEGGGGYAKEMSAAFLAAEIALFKAQAAEVDIIVTTALVPAKRAPVLIPDEVVSALKPGSVIVDLAAEQGGNCSACVPGEIVVKNGVTIIGVTDLPSRMASSASRLFATNVLHLLSELGGGAAFKIDRESDVVRPALVVHEGEVLPRPPPPKAGPAPAPAKKADVKISVSVPPPPSSRTSLRPPPSHDLKPAQQNIRSPTRRAWGTTVGGLVLILVLFVAGRFAPRDFLQHSTVFILACFVGWQVIWSVTPALHTPLMSVTNAISGIIIIGGMLQVGAGLDVASVLGALAALFAAINISGGFLVTERMLRMSGEVARDSPSERSEGGVVKDGVTTVAYLVAGVLFIRSLGGLSKQETAQRGSFYGAGGMAIAIAITAVAWAARGMEGWATAILLVAALVIGGAIGATLARRVEMTGMPELVAILHSFVGLAAVLVGFASYLSPGAAAFEHPGAERVVHLVEVGIGIAVGALTFTGSIVAWAKLKGTLSGKPLLLGARHVLNGGAAASAVGLCVPLVLEQGTGGLPYLIAIAVLAGLLGIHLVMAIGGADMPVVVSLLNSYSGWAAAAAGFVLSNDLLIVTGALVGSSGAILSIIMCRAMNRSIVSVVFGGFGTADSKTAPAVPAVAGDVVELSLAGVAELLRTSKKVIVVPGYGMAVARAQGAVFELTTALRKRGAEIHFAIHPVAGRLPGHMNVLLAESGVPYDLVMEMDEINRDFVKTDAVLVIGANDIVNPGALEDPSSAIYGMPVLEVWKAATVVVLKRGMAAGYAGVENPLFHLTNTRMLFGDAKKSIDGLVAALRGE